MGDQTVGEKVVTECAPPAPTCDSTCPPGYLTLCSCKENKLTKEMEMHCNSKKTQDMMEDKFHCTCHKSTGTTTAAPVPQKGEPCSAQNCAEGLACLAKVWVDGAETMTEFRYETEKPKCLPYDQDPMIKHLTSQESGPVADGKSCSKSKECGKDSVCVQAGVYIGTGQADAECRSSADANCLCGKAADSSDGLVKKYLSHKKRRFAIFV